MLKIKCKISKNSSVGNVGKKKCPFLEKSNFFEEKMLKTAFFAIDKIYNYEILF